MCHLGSECYDASPSSRKMSRDVRLWRWISHPSPKTQAQLHFQISFSSTRTIPSMQLSTGTIFIHGMNMPPARHWNLLYSSSVIGSVFAASNGDVFAGTISPSGQSEIQRWTANGMNTIIHNTTVQLCYGLFVDDIDRLYCSLGDASFVMMLDLNDSTNTPSFVAGQASPGNTSDRLNIPAGIFVTFDYELYVADSGNNQNPAFPTRSTERNHSGRCWGTRNGDTCWPLGSCPRCPRIHVHCRSLEPSHHSLKGRNGFRCVAGCSSVNGSAHDQLSMPSSLSFDSYGNIFVADTGNRRIQKLELSTKFCGECDRDYCQANESLIPSIHTYISNLQLLCFV